MKVLRRRGSQKKPGFWPRLLISVLSSKTAAMLRDINYGEMIENGTTTSAPTVN